MDSITPDTEHKQETNDNNVAMPSSRNDASAPRRRWSTFYLSLLGPKFCYVYFIFILMKDINDPNQRDLLFFHFLIWLEQIPSSLVLQREALKRPRGCKLVLWYLRILFSKSLKTSGFNDGKGKMFMLFRSSYSYFSCLS